MQTPSECRLYCLGNRPGGLERVHDLFADQPETHVVGCHDLESLLNVPPVDPQVAVVLLLDYQAQASTALPSTPHCLAQLSETWWRDVSWIVQCAGTDLYAAATLMTRFRQVCELLVEPVDGPTLRGVVTSLVEAAATSSGPDAPSAPTAAVASSDPGLAGEGGLAPFALNAEFLERWITGLAETQRGQVQAHFAWNDPAHPLIVSDPLAATVGHALPGQVFLAEEFGRRWQLGPLQELHVCGRQKSAAVFSVSPPPNPENALGPFFVGLVADSSCQTWELIEDFRQQMPPW